MPENHVAMSGATIKASASRVWTVLTDAAAVKEFMFGTELVTDWAVGGPIVWHGVWQGRQYEDRGVILEFVPGRLLVNTHFSPLSGQEDVPENYHTLRWELAESEGETELILSQDNNASIEEAEHSKGMWDSVVDGVKAIAERV